jgi:hypothetical protein
VCKRLVGEFKPSAQRITSSMPMHKKVDKLVVERINHTDYQTKMLLIA